MLEHVFDSIAPSALAEADDVAVVTAIADWAGWEAAAAARRLAAIAELVDRQCSVDESDERLSWVCDLWDATAAQVGAALGISARRASSQMYLARSLRERLPKVNALFLAGRIGARLVSTISWRTHLVVDADLMAAIDADLAGRAEQWGPLSDAVIDRAIDAAVEEHDPAGQEWFEAAERGLDVQFGKPDDETGTRSVFGRLYRTHAELVERRLTEIARAVCDADPRPIGARRAEALAAVFAGADRIACHCGASDCPQPRTDAFTGSVVIHVMGDPASVEAARDQVSNAAPGRRGFAAKTTQNGSAGPGGQSDVPDPVVPEPPPRRPAAVLADGSIVPTALLAELLRNGAAVAPVPTPCAAAENQYRPSRALQRFVRCRDLTCRFPGCDAPAEHCDIDHAVAYPVGPTHPSGLRCLCRKHHLLKTFHEGWTDTQYPDGRIDWRSPTGHVYTTYPGAAMFFPNFDVTTATLAAPSADTPILAGRSLCMPRRRRTRTQNLAQRIKNRRAHNDTS